MRKSKEMLRLPKEIQSKKRKAKGEKRKLSKTITDKMKEINMEPGANYRCNMLWNAAITQAQDDKSQKR